MYVSVCVCMPVCVLWAYKFVLYECDNISCV